MSVIAPDFPHHWKTTMLEQELGDPNAGMHVVRLWLHCHARMADCFEMTSEQLAAVCKYPVKQAKKLEAVLIECRWLQRKGKKIQVIGWAEHNARLYANQRNGRLGGRPPRIPSDNRTGSQGEPTGTHGFSSVSRGLSQPNPTKREGRGEEESREDLHLTGAIRRDELVCSIRDALCTLFSRKKHLGAEAMRALGELVDAGALPLSDSDWSALARFYAEKKNQPGAEDAHWRTSADAVALNLFAEIDKAKGWLAKHEIPWGGSEKAAPVADPDGWADWLAARGFPSLRYAEADGTLKREFREKESGAAA